MHLVHRLVFVCSVHAVVACGAEIEAPSPSPSWSADFAPILSGVADRGRDPSIVALVSDGSECSGILVAPDIVLTARHCLAADPNPCRPTKREPKRIDVWTGEDLAHGELVAHGWQIEFPEGCEADAGMLMLDRDVPGIHTSSLRGHGPAKGEHLRAIGFGHRDGPLFRMLRDHAVVPGTTPSTFVLDEMPCIGTGGQIAVDESSGEIVGVSTNFAPCGEGNRPIYVRTDAMLGFLRSVLQRSGEAVRVQKAQAKDAGVPDASSIRKLPKSSTPPKDFGSLCEKGTDCAAGVCIAEKAGRYCSRTCATNDKCPSGYHCVTMGSRKACMRS
jgi:hypothetical protein